MIMVIVIMMVVVMSVVMIGLVGRNFSFVLSTEEQLRRVEAEQVAQGAFWKMYQANSSSTLANYTQNIDGRQYSVNYTVTAESPERNRIDVKVNY